MAESGEARRPVVLVIDDDIDTLVILEAVLTRGGCEVVLARSGGEGLQRFTDRPADAVLLDVMMPGLSGIDVCRQLKRMVEPQFLPVILVTAQTSAQQKIDGLEAGADDYVTKPFDPDEVLARVRAMVRIKSLQEDLDRTQESLDGAGVQIEDWARAKLGLPPKLEAPRRKELSIVFCDIHDFTPMADQLDPDDLQTLLDEYLDQMCEAATANGGTINKVLGNGLMVLFNDPAPLPEHRLAACKAALEMRDRTRRLDAMFHGMLPAKLSAGIGVHTGEATVGHLGRRRLLDYTAIGSSVNLASRLQGLADDCVVASAATYAPIAGRLTLRAERRAAIKGLAHPVSIAEIVQIR